MNAKYSGRLELTWTNKDKRLLAHDDISYEWVSPTDYRVSEVRLLRDAGTVGVTEADDQRSADNLLIQGDALHALTSLVSLPEFADEYAGKVKLVYIDPPFNTGQTFSQYDDNLEHSSIGTEELLQGWCEIPCGQTPQIQHRQHVSHLRRPARIPRENRRGEPVSLPLVVDSRSPHFERPSSRYQRPLFSPPITDHQTMTRLCINQLAVPFDVIGYLSLQRRHQHPTGPLGDQLIQHQRRQIISIRIAGDYLQHQAYSFPAGQHQRNRYFRFGRVRRPLLRTRHPQHLVIAPGWPRRTLRVSSPLGELP